MATLQKLLIASLLLYYGIRAVDKNNFKTCEQSSFCRRCRYHKSNGSEYAIIGDTVVDTETGEGIKGRMINTETGDKYSFQFEPLIDSSFRLRINEEYSNKLRFQPVQALVSEPVQKKMTLLEKNNDKVVYKLDNVKIELHFSPFQLDFYNKDTLVLRANSKGRFLFEHIHPKPEQTVSEDDTKSGDWEEYFKEHLDSKPYGPMAVAMDFEFSTAKNVYGIPQHADNFALRSTRKTDPYRLYNLDVFEYELDSKMALYGSIPFMMGHGTEETVGVFWLNSAETWVDIDKRGREENSNLNVMESFVNLMSGVNAEDKGVDTFFMSETGIVDVFFLLGPGFYDVTRQYSRLTGVASLPPFFALGYHQSRWNYVDEQDVSNVQDGFDEHDIPMDVIWLDIEHTDGKKYFTWDKEKFSHSIEMVQNLTSKGRKLVTIVDPHIKRDNNYFLHNDATEKGFYVKNNQGKDFEGWCWPGSSSYLDFLNPEAADYYVNQYSLERYAGTTEDVYIWNDMNEPSVFNGPEVTLPKDSMHHNGVEHREMHNIYGFLQVMYTYEGLARRSEGQRRPFILTRSHFAGSQRFAAIWTGDNKAEWSHLKASIPMCLSSAVAGISFCGADVGGFFGNPDNKLFIRWYQTGAYLPFFRGHSHIDTKRREPWLFDDQTKSIVREVIRERYALLPFWYTLFFEHERSGAPIIRPLFAEFPTDTHIFEVEHQFLLGDGLMIRPVTEPDVSEVDVYFPGKNEIWYDKDTYQQFKNSGLVSIPVSLHKVPVFIRGGKIIPRKNRIRRSSVLMIKRDPYTLIVALDRNGTSSGELYLDSGDGFGYRKGIHTLIFYRFLNNQLLSRHVQENGYSTKAWLERVVIVGIPNLFKKAILKTNDSKTVELETLYDIRKQTLTIRKPAVNICEEWDISLH